MIIKKIFVNFVNYFMQKYATIESLVNTMFQTTVCRFRPILPFNVSGMLVNIFKAAI